MTQATLKSERLDLVPLVEAHVEHIIKLNARPEVMAYIEGRPHTKDEAVTEFNGRISDGQKVAGLGVWAGFYCGEFVGWWCIAPVNGQDGPFTDRAFLGYRLMPAFWRQCFAKEGSEELLRHAFEDLKLTSISAQTMAVNKASRATMSTCGLQYKRTFYLEFDDPIPGTELGEVEYEITREQWLASSSQA